MFEPYYILVQTLFYYGRNNVLNRILRQLLYNILYLYLHLLDPTFSQLCQLVLYLS